VTVCFEYFGESSGALKCEEFLDQLRNRPFSRRILLDGLSFGWSLAAKESLSSLGKVVN